MPTNISITNNDQPVLSGGVFFNKDSTPSFSGKVTGLTAAQLSGQTVQIKDSFNSVVGSAAVASDGSWSFNFGDFGVGSSKTLADGKYSIVAQLASNPSVKATYKVTIDTSTTTPTALVSSSSINGENILTNSSNPVISGRGEPGATINIFDSLGVNNQQVIGTGVVDSDGNYSIALTSTSLIDGLHSIRVTATDVVGNSAAAAPISLEVDTFANAPVMSSLDTVPNSASDGAADVNGVVYTNDNTPTIKGYAETGSEVTITDAVGNSLGKAIANGDMLNGQSQFTFQVTDANALSQGVHSFKFITTDRAGNVSQPTTLSVGVTRAPPPLPWRWLTQWCLVTSNSPPTTRPPSAVTQRLARALPSQIKRVTPWAV
jgi:hypothetical protein